jgi:DNA repair protein RadC
LADARRGSEEPSVKSLAPHDRPREKLERLGPAGLGDNELLALVLGHGARRVSALEAANEILATAGGLHGLTRTSRDELCAMPGVGAAKATQILAAVELGRRTLLRSAQERVRLATPHQVASFLLPQFGAYRVERFGLVLLDTKYRLLRAALLSVGTLDCSVVHPREVFREAAGAGAAAIVVFHNHPSGDPSPSEEDVHLTWRLVSAGSIMGIDIVDHLILADARYFSFKEAGRLRPP